MCMCFFFNDTATTEIYTLSLHDALPIYLGVARRGVELGMSEQDLDHTNVDVLLEQVRGEAVPQRVRRHPIGQPSQSDRKSTRLNSSHQIISYAVFCLKKKKDNKCAHHDI